MSNEKPVELTDDERVAVFDALAKINNPAGATALLYAVERIKAAARREALLGAAEEQERLSTAPRALGNGTVRFKRLIFANWLRERAERAEAKVGRVEALAEEFARRQARNAAHNGNVSCSVWGIAGSEVRAVLAEPERDEEGGR